MNKSKWAVVAAAGVLSVSAVVQAAAGPQNPPSAPVTVVNTTANPVPITAPQGLPVTGNVAVTGSINASQSGTWNVGITGTPTVSISGPVATLPEANIPVQFLLTPGQCFAVPSGNRLVIEFVSASAVSSAGHADATFALRINTSVGGASGFQILPMPKQIVENAGPGTEFAAFATAVPMRAYADASTDVCTSNEYVFSGPVSSIRVAITGHLVPQP